MGEVGHEVDFRVEGKVCVHQVVHARGDGIDVGVLLLRQLTQAHSSTEILSLFVAGKLTPFLADGWACTGAAGTGEGTCGCCRRKGE